MATTAALIAAARPHFLGEPFRAVRLPDPLGRDHVEVDALFTNDGAPPRWDNLGLVLHRLGQTDSVAQWEKRLVDLPVSGTLLASDGVNYLLLRAPGNAVENHALPANDRLPAELAKYAGSFAPRDLAAYRTGQLSFADAAERISPKTLAFASRHRTKLHAALAKAITAAMAALPQRQTSLREPMFRFALAYLGARILEDKGFFTRAGRQIQLENDPEVLLRRTMMKTNGFFKIAYQEALPKLTAHPGVLAALAAELGPTTTFALVDHHDLGRLYELLIDTLRTSGMNVGNDLIDLQQHYTPMSLTERILAHLPLERIRPSERVIFDPTAGSGSFLLAATQRLAAMSDLPDDTDARTSYLARHVVGNDSDPHVKDIAFLRYFLIQQSERTVNSFPRPDQFWNERYQRLTRDTLNVRRGVVVANPPYAENGAEQQAATFVRHAMTWLDDGAQFAFVLPQTFMIQSSHGIGLARRELSSKSRILEIWQAPEGVVGLVARQPVCVVLGIVGDSGAKVSVARAVISGAEVPHVRTDGLLGAAWLATLDSEEGDWREAIAPPVHLPDGLPRLSDMFHLFTGPTPKPGALPTANSEGSTSGPVFAFEYVGEDRLWANPERRPKEARWLNSWRRTAKLNARHLPGPKIILSRSGNRAAKRPFRVCYDDQGHWPNNDHHCVVRRSPDSSRVVAQGFNALTLQDGLLWLTGILSSSLAIPLILGRRGVRHTGLNAWRDLPLPSRVDLEIIQLIRDVVTEEQRTDGAAILPGLQSTLDDLVMRSYGAPPSRKISRTGKDDWNEQLARSRVLATTALVGQIVDVDATGPQDRVLFHFSGTEPEQEGWLPLPLELPGWALDGTSFVAHATGSASALRDLEDRAALRRFQHPPRAYESLDEIMFEFKALGLE